MPETAKNILAHHRESLHGTLQRKRIRSAALGISKPYFVYEPPQLEALNQIPVLYLFRGHEREWINIDEDQSRKKNTALEDIDRMIAYGLIPPMVVVMPGLNSSNNWVPSLGIDMAGKWDRKFKGLGSGRFWRYLSRELLPTIEKHYPSCINAPRLMAGFSLGGYTVSLLATKMAGYFDHAAIYDGTLMWPDHCDPRIGKQKNNDRIWCKNSLFHAALGQPRRDDVLRSWNTTEILQRAAGDDLRKLRRTMFWIASASRDGGLGNRDRSVAFVKLLQKMGIATGFEKVIFDPEASHTWHWADRFLVTFLLNAFGQKVSAVQFVTE